MDIGMVIFIVCAICIIWKAWAQHTEKQKEENFKHQHPQEYAKLKQIEHDKERMRHESAQTGAGLFSDILRGFWK